MSTRDKLEATAKNIEGKIQAAFGDLTGDPEQQAQGEAKQIQAKTQHTVENLKHRAKRAID